MIDVQRDESAKNTEHMQSLSNKTMPSHLEEELREAACVGDLKTIQTLIARNVNVNAQNRMNGWTALHWACKRSHEDIVRLLLLSGADINIATNNAETPASLCSRSNIACLVNDNHHHPETSNNIEDAAVVARFIPQYIQNPPLNGNVGMGKLANRPPMSIAALPRIAAESKVVKVRVNAAYDPDFIEVEIPNEMLSYVSLLAACCSELGIEPTSVERIRKLPNTRLRNDNDIMRLAQMQELELVLKCPGVDKSNNYQSISSKNQTILY